MSGHDGECVGCEHDCPWLRTRPAPLGAPFCSTCDDHGEAVHAGYGEKPCDCGDHRRIREDLAAWYERTRGPVSNDWATGARDS